MSEITRWTAVSGSPIISQHAPGWGEWVKFSDHEAEIKRLKGEIEQLKTENRAARRFLVSLERGWGTDGVTTSDATKEALSEGSENARLYSELDKPVTTVTQEELRKLAEAVRELVRCSSASAMCGTCLEYRDARIIADRILSTGEKEKTSWDT